MLSFYDAPNTMLVWIRITLHRVDIQYYLKKFPTWKLVGNFPEKPCDDLSDYVLDIYQFTDGILRSAFFPMSPHNLTMGNPKMLSPIQNPAK